MHVLLPQLKTRKGSAQAIQQLFPEYVGVSANLRRQGKHYLGWGHEGGSWPDHGAKGKGKPLGTQIRAGVQGRSCICPQPKTGWGRSSLLSVLPQHGPLYASQQPCQIHNIPIFRTRQRPRKMQYLCPTPQRRWQS